MKFLKRKNIMNLSNFVNKISQLDEENCLKLEKFLFKDHK